MPHRVTKKRGGSHGTVASTPLFLLVTMGLTARPYIRKTFASTIRDDEIRSLLYSTLSTALPLPLLCAKDAGTGLASELGRLKMARRTAVRSLPSI